MRSNATLVPVELTRIYIREMSDLQIIELTEVGGKRSFPIVIGMVEACAIERRRSGTEAERPQTHDLLANVIRVLGASVARVEICDLRENTFFANVVLRRGGDEIILDSRPSDAIAVGIAIDAPIFVAEHVLAAASVQAAHPSLPFELDEDSESGNDEDSESASDDEEEPQGNWWEDDAASDDEDEGKDEDDADPDEKQKP
ncbi:MAG: bifunctional nuclease family protein [Planctomycetes bacterium]|nr:bifunctional nuclease family protein [Planctomycetota bacterium]